MRQLVLGFGVVALIAGTAMAGSLGLPNELVNGDFETGEVAPWAQTGSRIYQSGEFSIPELDNGGSYFYGTVISWAGDWDNPVATLRQVVDESQFPGWDPTLSQKEITIDFDRYLAARHTADAWRDVGMRVYIDYMDDGTFPDPFEIGYNRDLVYEEFVEAADIDTDDVPWEHRTVTVPLDSQPRFVSVEVELFAHFAEWSWIGIDNIDLEGRCIPEPTTLGLLVLALPLVMRRRR